jgi:hypothetical protein
MTKQQSETPLRSTIIEQQNDLINNTQQQQQSRRRFHRRKQMKRSKSVDLYQEPSPCISSPINNDLNQFSRQQRSTSRDYLGGDGDNLSSSSSTADIARVNQATLTRYKSLDSMTINNRTSNFNGKNSNHRSMNSNRRTMTKPTEFDFDSDDSVCGIPKPRK